MLLTVAATAFAFTACNDDYGDGPEPFESELIGSYKPIPSRVDHSRCGR